MDAYETGVPRRWRASATPKRASEMMIIRGITKQDFDYIVAVFDQWWGGPSSERASPFFFHELGQYALIAEEDGAVIGFLLGLVPAGGSTGYVHLVGIDPNHRRHGVGKRLYQHFCDSCSQQGLKSLKAIGMVGHEASMRFHSALGFDVKEVADYAGPGRARVVFMKKL
ncbi:MAG TPA: GNAT family N-acetyltransferase [Polyangiaceae bacterium]|nr:GNAT family N-acetyltransferase [Polyangiaceae bacterium]